VVLGIAAFGVRVGVEAGRATAGVAAAAALVIVGLVVGRWVRRRAEAKVAAALQSDGPLALDASLDCTCLPDPWPALAADTMGWAANGTAVGLPVRVTRDGQFLRIEKRRTWGTGKHPFVAQVAMAAIADVRTDRAQRAVVGSSLTFEMDGGEVLLDVALSRAAAELVAQRFMAEAVSARRTRGPIGPPGLEVTSPPPPRRTPGLRAFAMQMLTMVPWVAAMVGAQRGPAAAVTATFLFFAGIILVMARPVHMHRWLSRGGVVVAAGFVVDALTTGEMLRLAGAAVAVWSAYAIARLGNRPLADPTD